MSGAGDMEFRPLHYVIEAERLLMTTERLDGEFLAWPLHVATKSWTTAREFKEAFVAAIERRLERTRTWRQWPQIADQIGAAFTKVAA